MTGKELLSGMSYIDERFIHEAETETIKRVPNVFLNPKRYGILVACFIVAIFLAAFILPNILKQKNPLPLDSGIVDNQNETENVPPNTLGVHIYMKDIFVNEIGNMLADARRYYDPEQYDEFLWDKDAILAYYGKDLTPSYIPVGLAAADGNGMARIFAEKSGKIVEDTVWLSYYHAYYEDGSPKLSEDVAAVKGFSLKASKIGIINDCYYILPEDEIKLSCIGDVEVLFGYRSMPYGPYDPDTHEPSGYYDLYVAEFILDGIEYYIVAEQMEIEELVKVVSSIIFEKQVILDK